MRFRHEFRLTGLALASRLEGRLGERVVVALHRRQILIDGPFEAGNVGQDLEVGPFAGDGPLVDGERTPVGNDVDRGAAVDLGDGDASGERFTGHFHRRELEVANALDGLGRAVDGVSPASGSLAWEATPWAVTVTPRRPRWATTTSVTPGLE